MSQIVLEDVWKVFRGGVEAVRSFDLEIADGEFVVLVGPSGCGKTTVLRMVAGLERISKGSISIGDKVVNDVPPKERDIAMVFQNYALYPHMSVYDNMAFGLKLGKVPKADIDSRVREAARILDLGEYLKRKPAALSGGQRQRVAMGRAIVRDPAAFLMDEPLSNLDAKLRVQTRTEVSRLQKRLGTTMVYVTHDQTEAMTLGDRVAVMRLGTIPQVASPQELYDRPANLFVAGFIGSPAMNFMAGTLEDGKLRTGIGDFPLTPQMRQTLESARAPREVIVGIRPESFEDALIVPAEVKPNGLEFDATIDVVESLGSEKFVYFTRELGQTHNVAELEELARDSGRAEAGGAAAETVVARLDPASRITEGEDARLWVDVRHLHVFAPDSGRNLTLGDTGAPASSAGAAAQAAPAAPAEVADTETARAGTAEAGAAEADAAAPGQASTTAESGDGADSR